MALPKLDIPTPEGIFKSVKLAFTTDEFISGTANLSSKTGIVTNSDKKYVVQNIYNIIYRNLPSGSSETQNLSRAELSEKYNEMEMNRDNHKNLESIAESCARLVELYEESVSEVERESRSNSNDLPSNSGIDLGIDLGGRRGKRGGFLSKFLNHAIGFDIDDFLDKRDERRERKRREKEERGKSHDYDYDIDVDTDDRKKKGKAKNGPRSKGRPGLSLPDLPDIDIDVNKKTSPKETPKKTSPKAPEPSKYAKSGLKGGLKGGAKALGAVGTAVSLAMSVNDYLQAEDTATKKEVVADAAGGVGGALAGAAVGATVGSVIPIVGTAVGGLVGGFLGAVSGSALTTKVMSYFTSASDYIPDSVKAKGPQAELEYIDKFYMPKLKDELSGAKDPDAKKEVRDKLQDLTNYRSKLVKENNLVDKLAKEGEPVIKKDPKKMESDLKATILGAMGSGSSSPKSVSKLDLGKTAPPPPPTNVTKAPTKSATPGSRGPFSFPSGNEISEAVTRGRIPPTQSTTSPAFLGTDYTGSTAVNVPGGGDLGSYVKRFESGSRGPSAVGWDSTGGTSYGSYQIAYRTGTLSNFLKYAESNGEFGRNLAKELRATKNLDSGRNGTSAKVWKKFAAVDGGKPLHALEHGFIKATHYDVAYKGLSSPIRSLVDKDRGVQEALWSTAVQHGGEGASGIFNKVARKLGISSAENIDAQAYLKGIYQERSTRFPRSTAAVRASVKRRYAEELPIMLGLSSSPPPTPETSGESATDPSSTSSEGQPAPTEGTTQSTSLATEVSPAPPSIGGASGGWTSGQNIHSDPEVANLAAQGASPEVISMATGKSIHEINSQLGSGSPITNSTGDQPLDPRAKGSSSTTQSTTASVNSPPPQQVGGSAQGDPHRISDDLVILTSMMI